jgi:galactokinase
MNATELKKAIREGALNKYAALYEDLSREAERFIAAIDKFTERFGGDREISVFSVPGRSEISGNHTDHNHGCVLAGAIDRDIIAVAAKNDSGAVRFLSEGYPETTVELSKIDNPDNFENYTSSSLIAGMAKGFKNSGFDVGGYDAYATSDVLKGSGISSSAAYEVMIGNIFNHLYCEGKVDNKEIAKLAQYSENVFFGKPCGLMDQMACAVGGFVFIDFLDNKNPVVEPINFSLSDAGYSLCIVNTGGNHADLNEDYASVPAEMKAIASHFGKEVLRGLKECDILSASASLRQKFGDRAILRALHFINENERVGEIKKALLAGDLQGFFSGVIASGNSSFKYLQNVYTTKNVSEQGLSLALAITECYLGGKSSAYRVHGGGFAGTIQAFVKNEDVDGYVELLDSVFGKGSAMKLRIRGVGATKLF